MAKKVHHLIKIHKVFADSIYDMACGRFWRLSSNNNLLCCSHIEMVDCKLCLPTWHSKRKKSRDGCKHERRWYSHYRTKFKAKVKMCMCLDCNRRLSPKKYPKARK